MPKIEIHIPSRLFWIWWAILVSGGITALAIIAPGILKYLAMFMGIIIPSAIVLIGAAHALQPRHPEMPDDGWIGIEVDTDKVSWVDFLPLEALLDYINNGEDPSASEKKRAKAKYEEWKATQGYATPPEFKGKSIYTDEDGNVREDAHHVFEHRREQALKPAVGQGRDVSEEERSEIKNRLKKIERLRPGADMEIDN